jgi:lipoprotein-anchoring transpeptidase ErfK/SrfK
LCGNVYGQYACRITGSILFHSVPYEKQDKSTLEWWEYDKLGETASLGCIRLTVEDAKWIYDNCAKGTRS